jgi:hypothetical protein
MQIIGIEENDPLEYENLMKFYNFILSLKPKGVKDKGISWQALHKNETEIKSRKSRIATTRL